MDETESPSHTKWECEYHVVFQADCDNSVTSTLNDEFICQKAQKGRVEEFLHKFINGIVLPPPSPNYRGKPQRNYFEKGFLRKYALQNVTYEFFLADDRLGTGCACDILRARATTHSVVRRHYAEFGVERRC